MWGRFIAAVLISGTFLPAPLCAATVTATGGQVLLNRGEGYKQIVGSIEAGPGDTAIVNPGGSGQIVYPDGCTIQMQPGTVTTVAAQSPCATTSGPSATTFAIGAVVVGGGIAAAVLLGQKDKSASP